MKYFVISDIHGQYKKLAFLLSKWNPEEETLIILGDVLDRGPQSAECYKDIRKLKEKYGDKVLLVRGNHEHMLYDFMKEPYHNWYHYLPQGGFETIKSFSPFLISSLTYDEVTYNKVDEFFNRTKESLTYYSDFYYYMLNSEFFIDTGKIIFTHAAYKESEEKLDENYYCWERESFYNNMQTFKIPRRIFFGHTPTIRLPSLNKYKQPNKLWIKKNIVGIDGGAGSLNHPDYINRVNLIGVKIDEEGNILEVLES